MVSLEVYEDLVDLAQKKFSFVFFAVCFTMTVGLSERSFYSGQSDCRFFVPIEFVLRKRLEYEQIVDIQTTH